MRDLRHRLVAWLSCAAFLLVVAACPSVTQPVKVRSTEADYRDALTRINKNLSGNVVPSLVEMRDEDLAGPKRHTPEWWASKIGLVTDSASLASTVAAR